MTDWFAAIRKVQETITGQKAQEKIVSSPVSSPTTANPFVDPLYKRFSETSDDDIGPICEFFEVINPKDFPTPGQARSWRRNEWADWAKENGWIEAGEATHAWTWRHPIVESLVIAIAKTPSDWRTPMANAAATRKQIREFATKANALLRFGREKFEAKFRALGEHADHVAIKQAFAALLASRDEVIEEAVYTRQCKALTEGTMTATAGDVFAVCKKAEAEFGLAARAFLESVEPGFGARWDGIKLMEPSQPIPSSMLDEIKDRLAYLREEAKAEKEQKQAERERERAEREAKKAEKLKPKTQHQIISEQVAKRKNDIIGSINAAICKLNDIAKQTADFEIQEFEDPTEIKKQLDAANASLAACDILVQEQGTKIDTLNQQLKQAISGNDLIIVEREQAKKQLHDLARSVVDTVELAKTANPFQLVDILNTLAGDARKLL